jgi:hypothetical protein
MATKESFNISSENLVKKIREIIDEGNATSITIHNKEGKDLIHFPLTVGLLGVVLVPVFAAVGALAAVVGDYSITVEKKDPPSSGPEDLESR